MAVLLSRSFGRGYRVQCAGPYGEFPHVVNCFLMWVFSGCDGILSCSDWHKIALSFPLHIACNFERYATHRTPPLFAVCCQVMLHTAHRHSLLSAARSSSIRRHLAQAVQCTSSLLIPCAHVELNVKHHRTTPKPEVHITVGKAEAALARK